MSRPADADTTTVARYARTRSTRPWAVLAAGAIAVVGLAGCSANKPTQLDMGRAQQVIGQAVGRQLHATVGAAACPGSVRKQTAEEFSCTAQVGAGRVRLRVTVRNNDGDLRVELLDYPVRITQVVADLRARLHTAFKRLFLVSCPGPAVRILAVGARFRCLAVDGNSRRTVEAMLRTGGALAYRVVSPPPPKPASKAKPPLKFAPSPAPTTTRSVAPTTTRPTTTKPSAAGQPA